MKILLAVLLLTSPVLGDVSYECSGIAIIKAKTSDSKGTSVDTISFSLTLRDDRSFVMADEFDELTLTGSWLQKNSKTVLTFDAASETSVTNALGEAILGEKPTSGEVKKLSLTLKTKKDGTITYKLKLKCMMWFDDDFFVKWSEKHKGVATN